MFGIMMLKKLEAYLQKEIKNISFTRFGEKTTVCFVKLNNGFEIIGMSIVADPKEFDKTLGEKYAFEDVKNQLQTYLAFKEHNEIK